MNISIEESNTENISPILEEIIQRIKSPHKAPDSAQKDYLLILLVVLMIENGFTPVDDEGEILDITLITTEQLSNWKSQSGVYEVPLVLTEFKNTPVKLILSPLGAMALINVVIIDYEAETYSVCLPMSKYVVSPQATTIPKIFRDLKHFSMTFKNKVLAAVKSSILQKYGYASASLVGLPGELLYKIMLSLPIKDVLSVLKSCSRLRDLLQCNSFWHDLLWTHFPDRSLPTEGSYNWKDMYIAVYLSDLARELYKKKTAGSMHDHMDYSDLVSYIDNAMWVDLP